MFFSLAINNKVHQQMNCFLDEETMDYPMGVRQSATILFPELPSKKKEKDQNSGDYMHIHSLLFTYMIFILFFFTEKEIDTQHEKQESFDDLPDHLKIGKEFTLRVTVLQAYGLSAEFSDVFTQFK